MKKKSFIKKKINGYIERKLIKNKDFVIYSNVLDYATFSKHQLKKISLISLRRGLVLNNSSLVFTGLVFLNIYNQFLNELFARDKNFCLVKIRNKYFLNANILNNFLFEFLSMSTKMNFFFLFRNILKIKGLFLKSSSSNG